jgi:MFS superfamily sulfate permease-like transporter
MGTLIVRNGKSFLPKALPPGSEVILVTAGATLYSMYYDYPGAVVGEIPTVGSDSGLSILGMPIPIEFINVRTVLLETRLLAHFGDSALRLAVSCLLFAAVNFLSIMGIASGFETENDIAWSPSRELLAQGAACGVAAAVGSAPVSGSLSRSLVSRLTGTTSQLACLVTALCWILLQPYMSIMSPTPKAALSAIIVSAVVQGVLVPKDLLGLVGVRNNVVGWGTGIATLLTSPTQGFGTGLVLYLLTTPLATATPKKEKKA